VRSSQGPQALVGYTSGGAPFGLTEDEYDAPFDDDNPF
jgi:hypothetical protein